MEQIHDFIKDSVSGSFWRFAGFWAMTFLIIAPIAKLIMFIINRPFRHMNIRKHGWPPDHCDADGDIVEKESKLE